MDLQRKSKLNDIAKQAFQDSIVIKNQILMDPNKLSLLVDMSKVVINSIKQGGKLLLCGNGGSAADAQHLATELLVRLRSNVNRKSLPAISLALDTSMLTATSNDYSFEEVFSRPLSGLGNPGDVLLGITTSGKSRNIIKAFELAKKINIKTLAFVGNSSDLIEGCCDYIFKVPSTITARIQETHIMLGHILVELIEEELIRENLVTIE